MSDAELLVAHYGDKFDRKYFEARLLRARLRPVPMVRQADTCLIARSKLKLSSNRLGNLAEFLQVKTGKMNKRGGWPDWWMGVMRGCKRSLKEMSVYCAQDVQCLEECFVAMRHLFRDRDLLNDSMGTGTWRCPACHSSRRLRRGFYYSEARKFQRYQCLRCGKWGRGTQPIAKRPQ